MLTETEYKQARAILAKAEQVLQATAPDVAKRGGAIPAEVTDHPAWKAATNDLRGKVEQYEILNSPPDRLFAYITADANRTNWRVTVWTGEVLSDELIAGRTYRNPRRSFTSDTITPIRTKIGGRWYHGRALGPGLYVKLRAMKARA